MKVTVYEPEAPKRQQARGLPFGTLCKFSESTGYNDEILLRNYDGLVSLNAPNHTWDVPEGVSFLVTPLPKGSKITLEVE